MTSSWFIFALCLLAIAIGWLLGKYSLNDLWLRLRGRTWYKSYMQGIHLLLSDEVDQTIETFIEAWKVDEQNFEIHNALANMLRRKGEVDRAIRIHANLVECEDLPKHQIRLVTIELANDYISAGLLDRAERLLINVVNHSQDFEERALELLQQIYQIEKEWDKAITVAEQLLPKRSLSFDTKRLSSGKHHIAIAHYYCECAKQAIEEHNFRKAEEALESALEVHSGCARATLLKAELAMEKGNTDFAVSILDDLYEQEPQLIVEAIPILIACYKEQPEKVVEYLNKTLDHYPSFLIDKTIFENMEVVDPFEASKFLHRQVKKRPTLQGLDMIINEQLELLSGSEKENLELLHRLVADVLQYKASHRCKECGFSGAQLHWQCPQCQSWDTIRRIRGSEGD